MRACDPRLLTLLLVAPVSAQTCEQRLSPNEVMLSYGIGRSVAVDGSTAVFAAPEGRSALGNEGAVFVYERDAATGRWIETQVVRASVPAGNGYFGSALAFAGGHLVVRDDQNRHFAFRQDASGAWTERQSFTVPSTAQGPLGPMAIDGDTLIVAAPYDDAAHSVAGALFVYSHDGNLWSLTDVVSGTAALQLLGRQVALEGELLLASGTSISTTQAAIRVYRRSPAGWLFEQELTAPTTQAVDHFGWALAYEAGVAFVGAARRNSAATEAGSVFVYRRDHVTQSWALTQELQGAREGDRFGFTVAVSGDTLAVTSQNLFYAPPPHSSVHTFHRDAASGQWLAGRTLDNGVATSGFGWALAVEGRNVLIGAPFSSPMGPTVYSHDVGQEDCNGNLVSDACDIASGASFDLDRDGVPDECELVGARYCSPNATNSTGGAGRIVALGSDLLASRDLAVGAVGLPLDRLGYFLAGRMQGISFPPAAQGALCLSGTIGRYASDVLDSGATGTFAMTVDTTAIPVWPPAAVSVGETWSFQAWYRDLNPGPTSNFTDGIAVTFL